jgi:hypothetical protein
MAEAERVPLGEPFGAVLRRHRVAATLGPRQFLLVLDSCERMLVPSAAFLEQL